MKKKKDVSQYDKMTRTPIPKLILAAEGVIVIMCSILLQATGKRFTSSLLSSLRNGLIFIPVLLILESLRGIDGIQEAQPLSMLLTLPVAILFMILFFRKIPKDDVPESVTEDK